MPHLSLVSTDRPALSDIKRAKWFWHGVRERRGYVQTRREREDAAFHNPLCPVPIKRCCHAYGQELTGRSQHGHGSARTHVCTSSADFSPSLSLSLSLFERSLLVQEEAEEKATREEEEDHGLIGEHLDLWMYRQLSDRVTYNRTPHAHIRVNTWSVSIFRRVRTTESENRPRDKEKEREREREKWGDCANARGSLHHAL